MFSIGKFSGWWAWYCCSQVSLCMNVDADISAHLDTFSSVECPNLYYLHFTFPIMLRNRIFKSEILTWSQNTRILCNKIDHVLGFKRLRFICFFLTFWEQVLNKPNISIFVEKMFLIINHYDFFEYTCFMISK